MHTRTQPEGTHSASPPIDPVTALATPWAEGHLLASRTELLGMSLASVTSIQLQDHIFQSLDAGLGGWLLTANVDILRRFHLDPIARALYSGSSFAVADGMPLVWASRLTPCRLPERVAGSTLIWELAARAAAAGRRIYLLGGAPGAAEGAQSVLQARYPGLQVCGAQAPHLSLVPTEAELEQLAAAIVQAAPDILLCAFGSPKQEYVIRHLHPMLPRTWKVGVGMTFSFVAGQARRAPAWMQQSGLEWVHRLFHEPTRLARRYLLNDVPFVVGLFARLLWRRLAPAGTRSAR